MLATLSSANNNDIQGNKTSKLIFRLPNTQIDRKIVTHLNAETMANYQRKSAKGANKAGSKHGNKVDDSRLGRACIQTYNFFDRFKWVFIALFWALTIFVVVIRVYESWYLEYDLMNMGIYSRYTTDFDLKSGPPKFDQSEWCICLEEFERNKSVVSINKWGHIFHGQCILKFFEARYVPFNIGVNKNRGEQCYQLYCPMCKVMLIQ